MSRCFLGHKYKNPTYRHQFVKISIFSQHDLFIVLEVSNKISLHSRPCSLRTLPPSHMKLYQKNARNATSNTTHNEQNWALSSECSILLPTPPTVAAISEELPLIFLLGGSGLDGIQHFVLCSHFLRGPVGRLLWENACQFQTPSTLYHYWHQKQQFKSFSLLLCHKCVLESKWQVPPPLMNVAAMQWLKISRLIICRIVFMQLSNAMSTWLDIFLKQHQNMGG